MADSTKGQVILRPIRMITERPKPSDISMEVFREQTALLESLVTYLLDLAFDQDRVKYCIQKLNELGCSRSEIETWLLTCLAYHAALGPNHTKGSWGNSRVTWFKACISFGISSWALKMAVDFGKNFSGQIFGQRKVRQEAAMRAIHEYFFNSSEEILTVIEAAIEE